jgi:hypothetical protein
LSISMSECINNIAYIYCWHSLNLNSVGT